MSAHISDFLTVKRFRPRQVLAFARASARAGWRRVQGAAVPNAQAAVFAVISWLVCRYGLNQSVPIYAPIATWLCMGFSQNRRPRKVIELGIGVSVGVLVGELITPLVGFGWWQLLLIMLVMPLVGRMIDGADLLTSQTTIHAMVVVSMSLNPASAAASGGGWGRWCDAVIGSLIALIATALLPGNLTSRPRRYISEALRAISDAVETIAHTLRKGDAEKSAGVAYAQLAVAREQLSLASAAHTSSNDTAALNPRLRSIRPELAELDRQLQLASRLHISVLMLTRQARGMVNHTERMPEVADYADQLATVIRRLSLAVNKFTKPVKTRAEARALAHTLAPLEIAEEHDWRGTALVSLLRSCVIDLLQATGLSLAQARSELVDSRSFDDAEPSEAVELEHGSQMWGTTTLPAIRLDPCSDADSSVSDTSNERPL